MDVMLFIQFKVLNKLAGDAKPMITIKSIIPKNLFKNQSAH